MKFRTRFEGDLVLRADHVSDHEDNQGERGKISATRKVQRGGSLEFTAHTADVYQECILDLVRRAKIIPLDDEARSFVQTAEPKK